MKSFFSILIIFLLLLSGCSKNELLSAPTEATPEPLPKPSPKSADPSPSPVEEIKKTDVFSDEMIKKSVEEYFEKSADALTPEDFELLADFTVFEFQAGDVTTLKDLPEFFPRLRYVVMGGYHPSLFSEEDMDSLKKMSDLRGISLYTDIPLPSRFAENLEYVNISYSEELYLSEENNLGEMSVLGSEFMQSQLNGNIKEYLRIMDGGKVYELFCTDFVNIEGEFYFYYETKIFISQPDENTFYMVDNFDVPDRINNASAGMIIADVDFDGKEDILILEGYFGNHRLVSYSCFLQRDEGYEDNNSFSQIEHPSLDMENKKILSSRYSSPASLCYAMYTFSDGVFTQTEQLIEELDSTSTEDRIYTVDRYIDGQWAIPEVYLSKDYTEEEIWEMFYEESGFWGLAGDRWKRTLNYQGRYNSIYHSTFVDAQVEKIINKKILN